ncbi:indoleamine 2,3-dioxygenase 1-like isoform X2 [Mizuhopecten yessoensis]|uniref:Indoleamine 2,3-dioxygenase 1 n=2 Tax=Mizuhopecten yessoensis TaxID=6573 RepID=A0A210PJS9_MIZYE|nr:indoleamine 2,3-dioxygenase 1-like isoform X2 [Mizuhopecten yessoensis]XP_021339974.1 indoleamine 2,3-dioxygenase 1-like isoform X2 [Mizuhopecten yessoensis]OWF36750.1 Indoleamine 2,3-dioxygenase 1 [Mizuhopecten yessoensis]
MDPSTLTLEQVEERFLVSRDTGFLLDSSQVKLQTCWSPFEEVAEQLTKNVENRIIREKVEELNGDKPIPDGKLEQLCLHRILTFLTAGYIWQDGEETVPMKLPRCLAVPLTRVSDALGMKPILSYPSMILANWQMQDTDGPFDFRNLNAMYQTPGGDGAEWFILTHVVIEQRFAPAIEAIVNAMKYSTAGTEDNVALVRALEIIPGVMVDMMRTFKQIKDGVVPEQFYDELRIFYTGWGEGKDPLPEGLIYEGVYGDQPTSMKGGSAAQSTTLQILDAALGITHEGGQKEILDEVRDYMLREHRNFCAYVRKNSNIRHYVERCNNTDVIKAYNKCISAIRGFRGLHKDKVNDYIRKPSERKDRNKHVEGIKDTGTGSTPYLTFLKEINEDTDKCKLSN